ncbi:AMP-binding enzyme [Actinomadura nitritigenes]|uniref:AMP-binding enzyme n=1 Tax=Actinomadura nitritigenes TaxID=134602 RepID=UPI003D8D7DDF
MADVAVLGAPNPDVGEEVKAVVQPASPDEAGPDLEAELVSCCRERLAHYKCLARVDFRSERARRASGTLFKRVLKDGYWAGERGRPAGPAFPLPSSLVRKMDKVVL